jgi:hypothetical protein
MMTRRFVNALPLIALSLSALVLIAMLAWPN